MDHLQREAVYFSRRKRPATPEAPRPAATPEAPKAPQFPGPVDIGYGIWDTIKAPLAGLWQGLVPGKNLNFEEYVRQQARKRRGRRVADNWLVRTITGK